jgi:hypothetical protein
MGYTKLQILFAIDFPSSQEWIPELIENES